MKMEPKAFASLSSGLLARKGAARPAMRPQGFGQATGNLEDLGWNDMGFDPPKPSSTPLRDIHAAEEPAAPRVPFAGLTPVESPVHSQQAELAGRLSVATEYGEEADAEQTFEGAEQTETCVAAEPAVAEPEATLPSLPEPALEEAPVLVALPQAASGRKLPAPRRGTRARSAPGTGAKAAFTLRLDPERHLKLRLACAVGGRSAQQLVTDALDQLLAGMPELDAMADRAKRKGS